MQGRAADEHQQRTEPAQKDLRQGFEPSYRRNVLRWIETAKQTATRAGRIEKTATLAALGQKVPQL